jgi:hypothetical protein
MYTEKQVGIGNQFQTLKQSKETSKAKINFYPLPIKIKREWEEMVLCTLIAANNGYLLRISQVLMKRSITQLLLLTVPKIINGICQHKSILILVDCVAPPGLKF